MTYHAKTVAPEYMRPGRVMGTPTPQLAGSVDVRGSGTATAAAAEARARAEQVLLQGESLRTALDRVLSGKGDSKPLLSPPPPPAGCAVAADFNALSETLSGIGLILTDICERLAV